MQDTYNKVGCLHVCMPSNIPHVHVVPRSAVCLIHIWAPKKGH